MDREKEILSIIEENEKISRQGLLKICKKKNLGATRTVGEVIGRLVEDKKIRLAIHDNVRFYSIFEINRDEEILHIIEKSDRISRQDLLKICKKKNLGATRTVDKVTERLLKDEKIRVDKRGNSMSYFTFGIPERTELNKNFKKTFCELQKELKDIETAFPDYPDELKYQINWMLDRNYKDIKHSIISLKSQYDKEIETDMSYWWECHDGICAGLRKIQLDLKFKIEIESCCAKIIKRMKKLKHDRFDLVMKRRNMGKSKRRDKISKEIDLLEEHSYSLERCFNKIESSLRISPFNDSDTFDEEGITYIKDTLTNAYKKLESIQ